MCDYKIQEDRKRLFVFLLFHLLLTMVLLVIAAGLYSYGAFLFSFLLITGIWFSIKAMCKYGSKWFKNTPVCEFTKDSVILYSLPGEPVVMKYKEISEVKILRNAHSIKLFLAGDKVRHPSGWYYAGVNYPFQRSLLEEVERHSKSCFEKHKVTMRKVESE